MANLVDDGQMSWSQFISFTRWIEQTGCAGGTHVCPQQWKEPALC